MGSACGRQQAAALGIGATPEQRPRVSPGKRRRAQSASPKGGGPNASPSHQPQRQAFRGINIQWPFSDLILKGVKTAEARKYPLGHRNIAQANEELWIIETLGPSADANANALADEVTVSPRPTKAQIVGTVVFTGWTSHRVPRDIPHKMSKSHRVPPDIPHKCKITTSTASPIWGELGGVIL